MIKLIKTTGEELEIDLKGKELTLAKVKEIMYPDKKDFYIEVKKILGRNNYMVLDEDGKFKQLQLNYKATEIYRKNYNTYDFIVGNVLITDELK